MSLTSCCVKGFEWDGQPEGHVTEFPIPSNRTYVTGTNSERAVLFIADIFGWEYPNNRLLADHIAKEAEATVYVPDFFDGNILPFKYGEQGNFDGADLGSWLERNSRERREPDIFRCAHKLRASYPKLGAIGYCYGGWAVFRLGASSHAGLVDCISTGHPSLLTKEDIEDVRTPTQVLAPEIDPAFEPGLKELTWRTLQKNGVELDYQHFPGAEHSCFTRGDPNRKKEREVFVRGKAAVVAWLRMWLCD